MVVLSSLVFLLPLVLAGAGAVLMRGRAGVQLAGATAGFLSGILAAMALSRTVKAGRAE